MALTKVSTDGVKDDAITSGKIPANAVGASELADNAVDTNAIANDAVTFQKIADSAVGTNKLQNNCITTNRLTSGAVTAAKLGNDAVITAKIADSAVTTDKIANDSINHLKLANGSVGTNELMASAVGTTALLNSSVTTAKIADNAVDSDKLAHGLHLFCTGSNKGIILQGNIGEIGDVTGFQAVNDAANANTDFGIRANTIRFATTSAERVRVTDNGLTFNGDTAAANALSDYEEGTWTPVLEGTSTIGTATYTARGGYYTKIGNKVFWEMYIAFNNGNGSGTFHITGLPYAVANNGTYPAVNIGYVHNFALRTGHHLYGLHASGSSYLYFYEMPDGGGANLQPNYDGSGSLIMSGHYEVA